MAVGKCGNERDRSSHHLAQCTLNGPPFKISIRLYMTHPRMRAANEWSFMLSLAANGVARNPHGPALRQANEANGTLANQGQPFALRWRKLIAKDLITLTPGTCMRPCTILVFPSRTMKFSILTFSKSARKEKHCRYESTPPPPTTRS